MMEPQELLDWLDAHVVGRYCALEESFCCLHFLGMNGFVEVDEDVFAHVLVVAEATERQQQPGVLYFSYPIQKLQTAVEAHLRLRKLHLLLED